MKFLRNLFLFITLFNTFLFAQFEKNILILNSYHRGFLYSDNIIKGIENSFYKTDEIDVNVLYMDYKRVNQKGYLNKLLELYSLQLKNKQYDTIIAIDKFAYDFAIKNKDKLFNNIPLIYTGIETLSEKLPLNHYSVLSKRDITENIKFINRVMPKLKKLYIINDSLSYEKTNLLVEEALKDKRKRFEIEYIEKSTLEEITKKFSTFKQNEAIFFIKFYEDKTKKLNKDNQIERLIHNIKLPIFITDDLFLTKGVVGGKLVPITKLGNVSGKLALDILAKKQNNLKNNKIYIDYDYKFDSLKLREFNISPYYFYNKYEIINKPLDFFQRHRDLLEILFLLFPLLVLLVIGLLHNIYYRRKTENLLKERIEFDETLLNAIESPIFWQNSEGKIVDFNTKFCSMIDIPAQNLYFSRLKKFRTNKHVGRLLEVLEKYERNPQKYSQFTFVNKNFEKKVLLIKQATYKNDGIDLGLVTIFTDITKEIEIEKEKERNQEFLIQQSKLAEIGEIFSAIAHQWKAPLVEITTIAQESFYANGENNKENESYVKDIMTQVKYMNDTINDFQDFIKPSNKKTTFDIYEAITSLLKIVEHNIKFNYIKVDITLKENTNVRVYGYRNEFMQSFLNIINNAKDELVKKDFKNRSIKIEIFNDQNKLFVNIKDNAGGIDEKNIENIFNPYYSTKESGSGIGLYMAKVIIEDKMHGKITVRNTKVGACFTIILEQN
ncbi:ATP-binding protein [Malaciobacter mytili]|uniref:sensor histidine kinase n=1 Tax=Malaciobacter mytili TaxID=603050 RepID=UPI003BB19BDC